MWRFTGGLPETKCGAGSTLAHTEGLRESLPVLFRELGVSRLLDAPCGDLNWMSQVDLSGIAYIGVDNDAGHLVQARSRTLINAQSIEFFALDVVNDDLPTADAVLCRDFLQHLPNASAVRALKNIARSDPEWLIATSFLVSENIDIDASGMFRQLNLTRAPISLSVPQGFMEDGGGRVLGVWSGSELNEWARRWR